MTSVFTSNCKKQTLCEILIAIKCAKFLIVDVWQTSPIIYLHIFCNHGHQYIQSDEGTGASYSCTAVYNQWPRRDFLCEADELYVL